MSTKEEQGDEKEPIAFYLDVRLLRQKTEGALFHLLYPSYFRLVQW